MISISSHEDAPKSDVDTPDSGIEDPDPSKSGAPPVFVPASFFKSTEKRIIVIYDACGRLERQVAELSDTIARIDTRTAQTHEDLVSLARLVGRLPGGGTAVSGSYSGSPTASRAAA